MKNKLLILWGISCLSITCFCGCGKNVETVSGNADATISSPAEDEEMTYAEKAKTGVDLEVLPEYDPTGVTNPIRIPDDILAEQKAEEEKRKAELLIEQERANSSSENDIEEEVVIDENEAVAYDIQSDKIKQINNGININALSVFHFDYMLPIATADSPLAENKFIAVDMKNVAIDTKLFKFDGTAYAANNVDQYVVYCDVDEEKNIKGIYMDCNFLYKIIEDGNESTLDYSKYYIPEVGAADPLSEENLEVSDNDVDPLAETEEKAADAKAADAKAAEDKKTKEEDEVLESEEVAEVDSQEALIKKRKDYLRSVSIGGVSLGMTKSNVESTIGKGVVVDGLDVYKNENGALIIAYEKNKDAYLGDELTVYQIVYLANPDGTEELP